MYEYIKDSDFEYTSSTKSKNYLDTLIHEMLHVYNPDWSESKVSKTANEMTDIIWSKNYRRIKR